MRNDVLRQLTEKKIKELQGKEAVLIHSIREDRKEIKANKEFISIAVSRLETMRMAQAFLQELVDLVSRKNIERIEQLVNSALSTIFFDQEITFKIKQTIKRNMNTYEIVLMDKEVERGVDSFGGGIIAVVALVLKILFCLFSKRYPIIVLDESLAFLSDKYIKYASHFINEMSKEFNIHIILVTHQPLFAEHAGTKYIVERDISGLDSIVVEG